MAQRMNWDKLLSTKRIGRDENYTDISQPPRSEFTRDYDRIIFSSAFRRLQDKTQVFPLAKNDYVRTRLTHSLEVASVGRSLGVLAGDMLKSKEELPDGITPQDVGTIVAAACLAHDIGNPPFGHAGESAIQEWFETNNVFDDIVCAQKNDFLKFEGNAQGFRTLCTLQQAPQKGGLQLTSAVLGAFTKYPRASVDEDSQDWGISGKKFGFMQSEKDLFAELSVELCLIQKPNRKAAWYRHPLAFLVEAADDICYHVMDIEDGFKAGCIAFDEIVNLHQPWLTHEQRVRAEQIKDKNRRVEYFRAATIESMIHEIFGSFTNNYDDIMEAQFDRELSARIVRADEFRSFKKLANKKVYKERRVTEIEACGFEVIGGLLTSFTRAIDIKAKTLPHGQNKSRTLLSLMPVADDLVGLSAYKRLLLATDFISGMTDSFAVELYQRISGISLP